MSFRKKGLKFSIKLIGYDGTLKKEYLTLEPNNNSSLARTAKEHSKAVNPAVPSIIDFLLSIFLGIFIRKFASTFAYWEKPPK